MARPSPMASRNKDFLNLARDMKAVADTAGWPKIRNFDAPGGKMAVFAWHIPGRLGRSGGPVFVGGDDHDGGEVTLDWICDGLDASQTATRSLGARGRRMSSTRARAARAAMRARLRPAVQR